MTTVKELIKYLQSLPEDARVFYSTPETAIDFDIKKHCDFYNFTDFTDSELLIGTS